MGWPTMTEAKEWADVLSKGFQCLFFLTTGVLAALTYHKAGKRGFWQPVNAEYYKRVIEALSDLSKELYSEIDDKTWSDGQEELYQALLRTAHQARVGSTQVGRTQLTLEIRLARLVLRLKSEPFVPLAIRTAVIDCAIDRLNVVRESVSSGVDSIFKQFSEDRSSDVVDVTIATLQRINFDLENKGCGLEGVQKDVDLIRTKIQKFCDSFGAR